MLIIGTFGELSPPLFEWRLSPQAALRDDAVDLHVARQRHPDEPGVEDPAVERQ